MKLERMVKQMVYCNKIKEDGGVVMYAIGGTVNDISGEMIVDYDNRTFEIVKQPEKSKVYSRHVSAMLQKAFSDYANGEIKERLAYEIG